jgi:DNA-binding transcriptional ArsR family regulator
MRTDTKEKILSYIKKGGKVTSKDLSEHLAISRQALFKHLPKLLKEKVIKKVGTPPRVYYFLGDEEAKVAVLRITPAVEHFINERYIFISPSGDFVPGWRGFQRWCEKTNQEPAKTAKEYVATQKRYDKFRRDGVINGTQKLQQSFDKVFLNRLLYLDFYSIERFGKTKLGQMLLYAKQSQDRTLIRTVVDEVRPGLLRLVKKYAVDGVAFIPPTVKREVQFMKELERQLHLPVRILKIGKIKTAVVVPQKTLTKLADRIENARQTIVVGDRGRYKNILLIDDAVGSGATLNETAGQIRRLGLSAGKIIGVSITGSFKGFDVISEV